MSNVINNIYFKTHTCKNMYGERNKILRNQIALYVVLTRNCNAACNFCEYRYGKSEIDIQKFKETLEWLNEFCDITTVHFTGGEPTLELSKLKQLLKIIKQCDKFINTSVNTNGVRLSELECIEELDNISLSRHEITDEENIKLFGTEKIATLDDIKAFKDKNKIHLSCNLIKGHIDSTDKILEYLELASDLGINDVGFVSLMKVNEYCKDNFIDFTKINIQDKISDNFIKSRCFENISDVSKQICCKCENYLYRANNKSLISMYHRHAIKNSEIADYLVYDNNELKQGFNGDKIR